MYAPRGTPVTPRPPPPLDPLPGMVPTALAEVVPPDGMDELRMLSPAVYSSSVSPAKMSSDFNGIIKRQVSSVLSFANGGKPRGRRSRMGAGVSAKIARTGYDPFPLPLPPTPLLQHACRRRRRRRRYRRCASVCTACRCSPPLSSRAVIQWAPAS